ncbi:hypothetical protein [Allomesorhizobium camelthorni]|uniref:hypothetical protein n=1 Tax=Allomesorhizobium camelthorni TaxID=475069 RepID=UPI00197FC01F|nr:hypothetical protein [Mesorhizobium camelthorni]
MYTPQYELDFAIPFLNEDIPLYVDPFLLWKSPSFQDKALHQTLIAGFNHLGILAKDGFIDEAVDQLVVASECDEIGLGNSPQRTGKRIGRDRARDVLSLFQRIPQYREHGFRHFEEIQLFVDGIGKDRVSDIACSFIKSFLIDYTYQECAELGIAMQKVRVPAVYSLDTKRFEPIEATLPVHPETGNPLLLTPKRWLRHVPWLNYDVYFRDHCQSWIGKFGQGL